MKVLVAQSCLTLCNIIDCSPTGSSVHGHLKGRILEWVAVPFSGRSSQPRDQTQVSYIASRFFTVWITRYIKTRATVYLKPSRVPDIVDPYEIFCWTNEKTNGKLCNVRDFHILLHFPQQSIYLSQIKNSYVC